MEEIQDENFYFFLCNFFMAQIIDTAFKKKDNLSQIKRKYQNLLSPKKMNYFRKVLNDILPKNSQVKELQKDDQTLFIRIRSYTEVLDVWKYQDVHINYHKEQVVSKFYFEKNVMVSTIFTKQKRINLLRSLLKMKQYSNLKIAVDSGNGMILGSFIVRILEKTSLKFITKLINQFNHSINNLFCLLAHHANEIPPKLIEVYGTKKRQNLSNFIENENKIYDKMKKYMILSQSQIKLNKKQTEIEKFFFHEKFSDEIATFSWIQDSLGLFEHESFNEKSITSEISGTTHQDQQNILTNLQLPEMPPNMKDSFVWNESQVENSQCLQVRQSNLRGGWNKIMVAKVSMRNKQKLKEGNKSNKFWENEQTKNFSFTRYEVKIVGIKEPLVESERYEEKVKNEVEILRKFSNQQCPFLLRYYYSTQPNFLFKNRVMMDFIFDPETFTKYLQRHDETQSVCMKLFMLTKIAHALYFIHKNDVVHMDISSGNVIVTKNSIKIIDFGESYHSSIHEKQNFSHGFTIPFVPPQRFKTDKYNVKYDIYSLMVIIYKTLFNQFPFRKSRKFQDDILKGNLKNKKFLVPEVYDYDCYEKIFSILLRLIDKGLGEDPDKRPFSSWLVLIMKEIFYWFEDYIFLQYNF